MRSKRSAKAKAALFAVLITVALLATSAFDSPASAAEIDTGSDWQIRWDNTLKYSNAFRVSGPNENLTSQINNNDGDNNFDRGLISNRIDLLTELDIRYHSFGFRTSAAAWYDERYFQSTDNKSPSTVNGTQNYRSFPTDTQDLNGRKLDLLDAFVYDNFNVGNDPVTVRLGRHTVLWGESLLFPNNGIAYGQAPIDIIKLLSVPNTQAKELFLPVTQLSTTIQVNQNLTLVGYTQFEFRRTRLPGVGSYFADEDVLDAGGERLIAAQTPGGNLYILRGADRNPSNLGQGGIGLQYKSDALGADFGLYILNYSDKVPQVYVVAGPGAPSFNPAIGNLGQYHEVFADNVHLFGLSASTTLFNANVAGEVSVRTNTPLISLPAQIAASTLVDSAHPPGAVGDVLHAQLSYIYLLSANGLWQGGDTLGEIAYNHRLSITRNAQLFDTTRSTDAVGLRGIFEPTWFQVLPGLDLTVPLGIGYSPKGRSSDVVEFNGQNDKGGDVSIGGKLVYLTTWNIGFSYTYYFGNSFLNPQGGAPSDSRADRDFVSFFVAKTF